MSKKTESFLNLMPEFLQQIVRNQYYEFKIARASEKDEPDLSIISKMIQNGQNVIDIGANYGIYTKHLSSYVGDKGKVFSFEPIKKTYKSLQHNCKALQLNNVETFKVALSDTTGKADMSIPDYDKGGVNFYEASLSNKSSNDNSENVDTGTLDEIFRDKYNIDFIKIDVEGHELNVLKGGQKLLNSSKPFMLIEINGGISKENLNSVEIIKLLTTFGYKAFARRQDKLIEVTKDDEGFNYFFLTVNHQERFTSLIQS